MPLSPSGRNRFGVPTPRDYVQNTATERRRPKAAGAHRAAHLSPASRPTRPHDRPDGAGDMTGLGGKGHSQPVSRGGSRLATEERQEGSRVEVVHGRLYDSQVAKLVDADRG